MYVVYSLRLIFSGGKICTLKISDTLSLFFFFFFFFFFLPLFFQHVPIISLFLSRRKDNTSKQIYFINVTITSVSKMLGGKKREIFFPCSPPPPPPPPTPTPNTFGLRTRGDQYVFLVSLRPENDRVMSLGVSMRRLKGKMTG